LDLTTPPCFDAPVRLAFIENDDSFTWNVLELLPSGVERVLARGGTAAARDAVEWAEVLVVGPGPKDPERAGLVEPVRRAAARRLPTLGICLGHQALGLAFGARLVRAVPAHGKKATAVFAASRRFPGVEGPLEVMRYHSLSVEGVAAPLEVVATLADGTVMAVEHQSLPMAGLQFHPDSHGTPRGREVVEAFFVGLK
jgi:anthranilate synthase/aminodeoxychorismate synthase-like glutamine amidotransferase